MDLDFPGESRIFGVNQTVNDKAYIGLGSEYRFDKLFSDFYSYEIKPSSIQDASFEQNRVYPNPTHNLLYIQNETTDPIISFKLYDQSGKIVKLLKRKGNNFEIDMSDLVLGSYILSIQKKNSVDTYQVTKI